MHKHCFIQMQITDTTSVVLLLMLLLLLLLTATTSRGGVANGTHGLVTGGEGELAIDIHHHEQQQQQHRTVTSLETVVDRILAKGPPQSSLGNPGPLGLAGFAATTFMLSCYNAGLLNASTQVVVLPMALWYGGAAQLMAGLFEYVAGNSFGATAFCSYGAFWLSFATLLEFGVYQLPATITAYDAGQAIGLYLFAWTVFTFYMMIASFRMSYALVAVFFPLTITFILLTSGQFAVAGGAYAVMATKAGGWMGIFTAFAAWYASAATTINGTFGAQIFPIGVIGPLTASSPELAKYPAYITRQVTASQLAKSV